MRLGKDETRISIGLGLMTQSYARMSDVAIRLEETDRYWIQRVSRCPVCCGWSAAEPVCYQLVGTLQAGLAWLTGGREYRVTETECIAKGDAACVVVIDKTPLAGLTE